MTSDALSVFSATSSSAGKGNVTRWERLRKQNHWLDALYNACAAGHFCGVRLVDEVKPKPPPAPPPREEDRVSEHWLDRYRLRNYPRW